MRRAKVLAAVGVLGLGSALPAIGGAALAQANGGRGFRAQTSAPFFRLIGAYRYRCKANGTSLGWQLHLNVRDAAGRHMDSFGEIQSDTGGTGYAATKSIRPPSNNWNTSVDWTPRTPQRTKPVQAGRTKGVVVFYTSQRTVGNPVHFVLPAASTRTCH